MRAGGRMMIKSRSKEYGVWQAMHERCRRKTHPSFKNYGGRGIGVCAQWESFDRFISDMGPRPPGRSLDRINNNGNYEPSNCRWATKLEQTRNTRNNVLITINGKTQALVAWCEIYNINPETASNRRRRLKVSWEDALSAPVRKIKNGTTGIRKLKGGTFYVTVYSGGVPFALGSFNSLDAAVEAKSLFYKRKAEA